jgi:hypothetical protein
MAMVMGRMGRIVGSIVGTMGLPFRETIRHRNGDGGSRFHLRGSEPHYSSLPVLSPEDALSAAKPIVQNVPFSSAVHLEAEQS